MTSVAPLRAAEVVDPAALQTQFEDVARRAGKSVVAISVALDPVDGEALSHTEELSTQKLDAALSQTTRTVGTGFVIDAGGYILTNQHVIADAQQLWITTDDRKVIPAIVVGSDPRADLAVLKAAADNLTPVEFATTATQRGQWALAMGNPFGLASEGEMALSVGIVSAVDRSLPKLASKENRLYSNLIQTTAQINPGNSGGPLFDLSGKVIGINTAVIMPQKGMNGVGFALPTRPQLLQRVHDLMHGKEIEYGYLGVVVSTATTRQLREAGANPAAFGAVVDAVESTSPAGDLVKPTDLIVKVAGHDIIDSDTFVRLVGDCGPGIPVRFDILRAGKPLSVDIRLKKRDVPSVAVTRDTQRLHWRGLTLAPVPANWAEKDKPAGAVVLGIDAASPFAKDGVVCGSLITQIAGKNVLDLPALQSVIANTPAEKCDVKFAPAPAMDTTVAATDR